MERLSLGDKKLLKRFFACFFSFLVLACVFAPIIVCTSITESQNSKAVLQARKKELNKKLREASNQVRKEAKNKEALDEQIKVTESQIDNSNIYISKLDEEISEAESEIAKIQEDIKEKVIILKKSLRAIYIAGDASTVDIILGAKNFEDFLDKVDIVRSVGRTIKKLIDDLHSDLEQVENKKKEISDTKEEKEKEKKDLEKNKSDLQALYDKSEALLSELEESEKEVKKHVDQNDAEIKAIDERIKKYYEEQRRLEEQQKKDKSTVPPRPPAKHTGNWVWPVPGFRKISSGFNDRSGRSHAHGAIDIAGNGIYGESVVAAGSGRVIIASSGGWGGGYGSYVVIDHGNGKSTVYGHMSTVGVKVGQSVVAGEKIGNVGNTGQSTGPHLHFEYRVNGVRTDPACILSY